MAEESGSNGLAYYEVGERRLARAGATLSRRVENGKGIWRLVLPRPDGPDLTLEGPGGPAEFRCVRNPKRAVILDARGKFLLEASPSGDAVLLEVSPNDLVHWQVDFE